MPRSAIKKKLFVLVIGMITGSGLCLVQNRFSAFNEEMAGFDTLKNSIAPGKVVCNIHAYSTGNVPAWVFVHVDALVQAEKGGDVKHSFASYYPEMIRFKEQRKFWERDYPDCHYIFARKIDAFEKIAASIPSPIVSFTESGNWYLFRRF